MERVGRKIPLRGMERGGLPAARFAFNSFYNSCTIVRFAKETIISRPNKIRYLAERGDNRVIRGGSYFNNPLNCRPANRNNNSPDNRNNNIGLRLCPPLPAHRMPDGAIEQVVYPLPALAHRDKKGARFLVGRRGGGIGSSADAERRLRRPYFK